MMTNAERAALLVRALQASIEGDTSVIGELYTDDVRAWTPAHGVSSAKELESEFARRDDAFSDIDLQVDPLDVSGDFAVVEWRASMTHSGPLRLGGDDVIEPTGLHVVIHGATVAEFLDDRICSLRQYWDELSVLEQLGVVGEG
jgi:ketosteroid isomerase-like protein